MSRIEFGHRIWTEAGKPRSGPIFELFKKDKYYYKFAIRQAKSDAANNISNDLHDALLFKDNNQFWKIWISNMGNDTSKNQTKLVGGLVYPHDISELFAEYFSKVCQPNSVTVNARLKIDFQNKILNYQGSPVNETDFFSVELISKDNMRTQAG